MANNLNLGQLIGPSKPSMTPTPLMPSVKPFAPVNNLNLGKLISGPVQPNLSPVITPKPSQQQSLEINKPVIPTNSLYMSKDRQKEILSTLQTVEDKRYALNRMAQKYILEGFNDAPGQGVKVIGDKITTDGGIKGQVAPSGISQFEPVAPSDPNRDPKTRLGAVLGADYSKSKQNLSPSAKNIGVNLLNMATSPFETTKNLLKIPVGAGVNTAGAILEKVLGEEKYKTRNEQMMNDQSIAGNIYRKMIGTTEGATALGNYVKGYTDPKELQRRLEEDPLGVFSDFAPVLGWTASTVSKVATANKFSRIANIANKVSTVATMADPYNMVTMGAGKIGGKIINTVLPPFLGKSNIRPVTPTIGGEFTIPAETIQPKVPSTISGIGNTIAEKIIGSKIKITDKNKNLIKRASGQDVTELILENDLGANNIDGMVEKTEKMVDNAMLTKLDSFKSIKTPLPITQREKLIGQSIINQAKNDISEVYGKPFDDILPEEIIPELQEQFNIIKNVDTLIQSPKAEAIQLEALKSLYDAYNSHLKYDPTKKRILSSAEQIRLGLQKTLEKAGDDIGVDIRGLNKKIAGGKALIKGLGQAMNRLDNNNIFGLTDTQTALLSAVLGGGAVDVGLTLGGKSLLENVGVRNRVAKKLYTKKSINEQGLNNINNNTINRATAGGNITSQFGGSNPTMNNSTVNTQVKGLPFKPGATVFPGSKGQLGNAEAPYKPNPSIRETGLIGQPYKKPVTPPKLPTIINKTKTDISNVLKTTPPPKLQAKSTIKLKSEFISPVSGKVQDPMKIPHDWASYSSADKTKYMDSLNKFNKSVAPKAPIQAKAKVNKEIPKEFTKYKNGDFGDLNPDIELYNYTKKYGFNAIDNTKRTEILRKGGYDKIEAQLRTEGDKLGKLPPAIVKQKPTIPKAPIKK